jgi:hypothetical protein
MKSNQGKGINVGRETQREKEKGKEKGQLSFLKFFAKNTLNLIRRDFS